MKKQKVEGFNLEGDKPSRLNGDRGNRYGDYMARHDHDHDQTESKESSQDSTEISEEILEIARNTDLS